MGRQRVAADVLDGVPAAPAAGCTDQQMDLAVVLADLPAAHRDAVYLRFVDGLSLVEIAEAQGIPVGTVKSRLHNALATLRADPRTKSYFEP
jgi:RNA polymerase sigma-70 factor (ECF subfamily)